MKIHSQWHGMLQLKEMPSEALQIEMREVLGDFIVSNAVSDNPDEKLINISGIGVYQSVRMEAMLKQLEPITTSGKINFSNSENDFYWQWKFENGHFTERVGKIVYSRKDAARFFPAVQQDDIPEFVGEIIDIFEDFLEEKGIKIQNDEKDDDDNNSAIIYGSDYGLLQDQLEETYRNWDLFV